eukprot:180091_1
MKMMKDKEKIRPWNCNNCEFLNDRFMVNGLWRYYNETNKCGLCGHSREHKTNIILQDISRQMKRRSSVYEHLIKRPNIDITNWISPADYLPCTLYKSVKNLSLKQLVHLLRNHFIDQLMKSEDLKEAVKNMLMEYKERIIAYFAENQIDGKTFHELKKQKFVKDLKKWCDNMKLHVAVLELYKVLTECDLTKIDSPILNKIKEIDHEQLIKECPCLQRCYIILQHFEIMTAELSNTNNVYPYNLENYFKEFTAYSAVEFLNDIDHVLEHNLKFGKKCRNDDLCFHFQRAFTNSNGQQHKNLDLKKQFFATNDPSDFVYISMLDRAHCLFKHYDDDTMTEIQTLLKEDEIKILHIPYNTGTYMEYHTLKPLYQNLCDELVRNQKSDISMNQFDLELNASKKVLSENNTVKNWKACKSDDKYAIKINEPIHIEHVLCIKVYCNFPAFCASFRASYRKIAFEYTIDDIILPH